MKIGNELNEMATELVQACNDALVYNRNGIMCDSVYVSAAAAKGRLLVHQLGTFGSIWSAAFGSKGTSVSEVHLMLGNAQEMLDAISKGRLIDFIVVSF